MDSNRYDIFIKIIEAGSIRAAAHRLDYTASAVSQSLQSLENELGVRLLIRRKAGLILTTEGEQLLPYIQNIRDSEAQLFHKVDSLKGVVSGDISIGSYHTIACTILPPLISRFNEIHPGIKFSIKEGDYTDVLSMMADGVVDFGFLANEQNERYEFIHYMDDPMFAVFPSDSEAAALESCTVDQLADESMILLPPHKEGTTDTILRDSDISVEPAYIVQEYETALSMIENHLGVGILPGTARSRNYSVSFVPITPTCSRDIGIMIRNKKQASTAVNAFLDFIFNDLNKKRG